MFRNFYVKILQIEFIYAQSVNQIKSVVVDRKMMLGSSKNEEKTTIPQKLSSDLDLLRNMDRVRIFAGNANKPLALNICKTLGIELGDCELRTFANSETKVCIGETVRGKDIFIIDTGSCVTVTDSRGNTRIQTVNDNIMNIYLLSRTCQRSGCGNITMIIPNFPYARQDKKDNARAPVSAADVVDLFGLGGVERIVAVELHNPCIQGFMQGDGKKCFDNLYTTNLLRDFFKANIFGADYKNEFIVVAPDAGSISKNEIFAGKVGLNVAIMSKVRDYSVENVVSKSVLLTSCDFVGKTAIIVDDMLDTGATILKTVEVLKQHELKDVIVAVTHGILSKPALDRINGCKDIRFVVVSDTLDQTENLKLCPKLKVFSVAPMLADVVSRLVNGQSISEIFK